MLLSNNERTKKMNDTIKIYKRVAYRAEVYFDLYPDNPREWSNLSTIISFSDRYNFNDTEKYKNAEFESWDDLANQIKNNEYILEIYPLYKYEHSAVKLSIKKFKDKWDAGQIGFVYVTRQSAYEILGNNYTPEEIRSAVETELDIYNSYINGDVYRVQVFEVIECGSCNHSNFEELECIDISQSFYDLEEAIESAKAELSRHDSESKLEELK